MASIRKQLRGALTHLDEVVMHLERALELSRRDPRQEPWAADVAHVHYARLLEASYVFGSAVSRLERSEGRLRAAAAHLRLVSAGRR